MFKKIASFKHLMICILIITIVPVYAYSTYDTYDSLAVNVVFKLKSQVIDVNFRSNKIELDKITVFYEFFRESKEIRLISNPDENNLISNKRISSVESYLAQSLSNKGFSITTEHRENAGKYHINSDNVIYIKNSSGFANNGKDVVKKVAIIAYKKRKQNIAVSPTARKYEELLNKQQVYPYQKEGNVRLGTNVLYDIVTVANLSLEVDFAKRFAIEATCTFSPWNINSTTRLRTLILQPEFKYYFKKGYEGHHIGLEGHVGWYNVSLPNSKTRYQDADGNTPGYGGGITYGYYIPISKNHRWGMDFTIGAGYTHLEYDCFYNVPNGIKYDRCTKEIWGLTKIGITFYLNFKTYK